MKILLPLILALVIGTTACSGSDSRTVRTQTTYVDQNPVYDENGNLQQSSAVKTVETTETKEKDSPGVIGSGLIFIGNIIAFPFRLIGSIFGLLF